MKHEGVKGSGVDDGLGKCEIESIDDNGFQDDGGDMIVRGSIKIIFS